MEPTKAKPTSLSKTDTLSPLIMLWITRILIPLKGHQELRNLYHVANKDLVNSLGLHSNKKYSDNQFLAQIETLYKQCESELATTTQNIQLNNNLTRLAVALRLNEVDVRILEFAICLYNIMPLRQAILFLGNMDNRRLYKTLGTILGIEEASIRHSLKPKAPLINTGLLKKNTQMTSLDERLELLSIPFSESLYFDDVHPDQLLSNVLNRPNKSELSLDDYSYLDEKLSLLRGYLESSIKQGKKGVNIYLHGRPGTGKTELVKALCDHIGFDLYAILNQDEDGDPISGDQRLGVYRVAQNLLPTASTFLLFDEVEDIFHDGSILFGRRSTAKKNKAWLNQILEENQIPTLWLSNSLRGLDPAFVRRFDLVLEVPIPPKSKRSEIIQKYCSDLLPPQDINRLAASEDLSPAVVKRISDVIRTIDDDAPVESVPMSFFTMTNNILEAQGHKAIKLKNQHDDFEQAIYSTRLINSDIDITQLAEGLKKGKEARICLYGPPGTGKTAFGDWLANEINMPLTTKKGSDLLSMWAGETEANIARAFKDAEHGKSVLLIDEVDGFLQERGNASKNWEISQVNEFLVQMENFQGIFIASTNLVDNLDQASLRRFDLKIKFGYLTPEQSSELFTHYCILKSLEAPKRQHLNEVRRLHCLTPGDFALVARRDRFNPIASVDELVEVLKAECRLKAGPQRTIGFIH